ncbi:MAG: phosphodiesterase/alkaline phosphatase [Chthoniobacteraceae bacterium]|nr:phosphodiesterase/alkaline phosphatase [Chthoniobacteraceae bacterium]
MNRPLLESLHSAVRHEGGLSRRLFLAYAAALTGLPALAQQARTVERRPGFTADPFTLGVASGDPDESGMVLWTRLAPNPFEPDGGMGEAAVEVRWEVAEDEEMRSIVRSGTLAATPLFGHSIHVEVSHLKPDRWYWYRFQSGDATSPIGRTRTLPEPGARPDRLRFAFASCQHFEAGFFSAYEQMAKDELDLVFHLGDYIYEGAGRTTGVRRHAGPKLMTLEDYRIRHSQYRADPLLQGMHARCPWFVTWDDHEVENNYAGALSQRHGVDPAGFLAQRACAYQAYYEMMPLRRQSIPHGPDMLLYRKASFGQLAELMLLDTRQYRSFQPNGGKRSELNAATLASTQTMLGAEQKSWLQNTLTASPATWNVLAQQVMMGMIDHVPGDEHGYSMDQWPGYAQERIDLVRFLAERRVTNPVVLTGDIHSNWVNDLRVDDRQPETPVVGTEFVGTSITSGGNGTSKAIDSLFAENAGLRFHNRQRGYVRCTVTPATWQSEYMVTEEVLKPGGQTSRLASFVVEAGRPGVKRA